MVKFTCLWAGLTLTFKSKNFQSLEDHQLNKKCDTVMKKVTKGNNKGTTFGLRSYGMAVSKRYRIAKCEEKTLPVRDNLFLV